MNETTKQAEITLKECLPGDITPEEIEMMVWMQTLLAGRTRK